MISLAPKPAIALHSLVERLDLEKIFGRIAPVHVDLGCGDGSFLCELARKHPETNFLGVDRLAGRVAKTSRKAAKIENVRVLRVETSYAVRYLLPPASVETFYLLFPDPWPKRRHHRRRIFTPDFLSSIHAALAAGGVLHIATDHLDYFQHIQRLISVSAYSATTKLDRFNRSSSASFEIVDARQWERPLTRFEKKFRAQAAAIYRLSIRKVSPVT